MRRSAVLGLLCPALISACAPSAPQPENTVEPADTQDTYFEGSRQIWDAARDRGVTFRAVGQEPGWLLEIVRDERLMVVTAYGADTLAFRAPRADIDVAAGVTRYRAVSGANEVLVTIREQPCADSMSGERFSRSVDVVLNGTTYHGCGRVLGPLR